MMKETQNNNELHSPVDPGYLMLAVYVLGVTFLVLFAWLGGSTAALENDQQGQEHLDDEVRDPARRAGGLRLG